MATIVKLHSTEKAAILSVINDAVSSHKGDIPPDEWKEPYMSAEELDKEQAAGVQFTDCAEMVRWWVSRASSSWVTWI